MVKRTTTEVGFPFVACLLKSTGTTVLAVSIQTKNVTAGLRIRETIVDKNTGHFFLFFSEDKELANSVPLRSLAYYRKAKQEVKYILQFLETPFMQDLHLSWRKS